MKKCLLAVLLAVAVLMAVSCASSDTNSIGDDNAAVHDTQIDKADKTDKTDKTDKSENNEDKKGSSEKRENVKKLSEAAIEIMKQVPEYTEGYPTLEDAVKLYEKANMAIGWIVSTEPVPVYDNDTISVDGIEYKRVRPDCHYGEHALKHHSSSLGERQELIFDYESLEAYLNTFLSPEEADLYIDDAKDINKFVEDKSGYLYALDFSYVPEGFGEEKYSLEDNGDGTYTFRVTYSLLDDDDNPYKEKTESFDLVQIDGRWVFDNFRVFKQN